MKTQYVICVKNKNYEASLELRKVYKRIHENTTKQIGLIRVIDESGEDYLFPEDFFVPISIPKMAEQLFVFK
jgi:hypothetical protein